MPLRDGPRCAPPVGVARRPCPKRAGPLRPHANSLQHRAEIPHGIERPSLRRLPTSTSASWRKRNTPSYEKWSERPWCTRLPHARQGSYGCGEWRSAAKLCNHLLHKPSAVACMWASAEKSEVIAMARGHRDPTAAFPSRARPRRHALCACSVMESQAARASCARPAHRRLSATTRTAARDGSSNGRSRHRGSRGSRNRASRPRTHTHTRGRESRKGGLDLKSRPASPTSPNLIRAQPSPRSTRGGRLSRDIDRELIPVHIHQTRFGAKTNQNSDDPTSTSKVSRRCRRDHGALNKSQSDSRCRMATHP